MQNTAYAVRISDLSSDGCSSYLPVVRAGVCVDCHFGSAAGGQFVTHRIMAAGHPRISFELDLFSSLQAYHQEDADYGWRKFGAANRRTDHVQMWAVGQATAIERSLALFQTRRGTEGIFRSE